MKYKDHIAVVIRYSGERTFYGLKKQFQKKMAGVPVEEVTSDSFEKTLRLSYQVALSKNRTWSIIVDADILLTSFFFELLPKALDQVSKADLGLAFRVWDRFYDAPKFRGIHVYRTEHLTKAIEKIPENGKTLRPESFVKDQLLKEGLVWRKFGNIVGLHDFFQRPQDIFAKMALRSHRSEGDVTQLLKFFNLKAKQHFDFRVALAGLEYGIIANRDVIDNSRNSYHEAFKRFADLNTFIEQEEFRQSQLSIDYKAFAFLLKSSARLAVKNYFYLIDMTKGGGNGN